MIISVIFLGIRYSMKKIIKVMVILTLFIGILSIAVISYFSAIIEILSSLSAVLEALIALPLIPWYITLCIGLYRKGDSKNSKKLTF